MTRLTDGLIEYHPFSRSVIVAIRIPLRRSQDFQFPRSMKFPQRAHGTCWQAHELPSIRQLRRASVIERITKNLFPPQFQRRSPKEFGC